MGFSRSASQRPFSHNLLLNYAIFHINFNHFNGIFKNMIIVLCLLVLAAITVGQSISSICSGDMLLDLPKRQLYIQLEHNGVNATQSLGEIKYSIEAPDSCRHYTRVVDRGDGSYIFELRVYTTCTEIKISLVYERQSLCNSPIILSKDRPIQPESCNCPIPLENWLQEADCWEEPQIEQDLHHWDSINFTDALKRGRESWGQEKHRRSYSVCHYQIIENKIYRDCFGEYDRFKEFLDIMLLSLARKMLLPNTEFLFNLGDYPLSTVMDGFAPIPLISWCGSMSTFDIVLPTYMMTNQILTYSDDILTTNIPYTNWEDKIDKAIFRGRDSNKLRLDLAKLAEKVADLDIGITAYFFHKETEYTTRTEKIPFSSFSKYRYIISVDGTVAAYRFPSLLSINSIVLKSESPFYEHFYSKLQPHTHYIPFNDHSILDVLERARTIDHKEIIRAAKQFTIDHLQPKSVYCYYAKFFQAYNMKLETPPVKVADGMEQAEDNKEERCNCDLQKHRNEL